MLVIQNYLQDIASHLKAGNTTEHTHRPALPCKICSPRCLTNYHVTNEPRRIACGAPDFEIAKGVEPIGHIEAKDIGISLEVVLHKSRSKKTSLKSVALSDLNG